MGDDMERYGAEQLGLMPTAKAEAQLNPQMSPIRSVAMTDHLQAAKIPAQSPTPTQVFASGIQAPTFMLLNQPMMEIEATSAPGTAPASPSCPDYLIDKYNTKTSTPCTATQQLLKYMRTVSYQPTPVGEPDCGVVAANKDQAAVAAYLKAHADINAQDPESDGFTALHHAAATGRVDMIALLVAFGANVDRRDYDGNKAQDIARMAARDLPVNEDGQVDSQQKYMLIECMHCLIQAKQAKDRTRRYLNEGYLEFPTSPKTPQHYGVSSGVIS